MGCQSSDLKAFEDLKLEHSKLKQEHARLLAQKQEPSLPLVQIIQKQQTKAQESLQKMCKLLKIDGKNYDQMQLKLKSNYQTQPLQAYFQSRLQASQAQQQMWSHLESILQKYKELTTEKIQKVKQLPKLPETFMQKADQVLQNQAVSLQEAINNMIGAQVIDAQVEKYLKLQQFQCEIQEFKINNQWLLSQLEKVKNLKQKKQEQLDFVYKTIESTRNQLKQTSLELRTLKQSKEEELAVCRKSIQNTQQQLKKRSQQLKHLKHTSQQQLIQYHKSIQHTQNQLNQLSIQLIKKTQQNSQLQQDMNKLAKRLLFKSLDKIAFKKIQQGFQKWLAISSQKSQDLIFSPIKTQTSNQNNQLKNPIIKALITYDLLQSNPSMPLTMFRFLQQVLDRKFQSDSKDLFELRSPKSLPQFCIQQVHINFGKSMIAFKNLGQIVSCMKRMFDIGHPYAVWFCKVFQLFHSQPVPFPIAFILTSVRMDFNRLIDKYDSIQVSKGGKTSGYRAKTRGKEVADIAELGGIAYLLDVVQLVYLRFSSDKAKGIQIIQEIKPDNVSFERYIVYFLANKLQKAGTNPEQVLNSLDNENTGFFKVKDFVAATKIFDLWISEEKLSKFVQSLGKDGVIQRQKASNRLNISQLREKGVLITKRSFLISFTSLIMKCYFQDFENLYQMFNQEEVNFQDFMQVIDEVDSTLGFQAAQYLFQESKNENQIVFVNQAIKTLLKYCLGWKKLGIFQIPEFKDIIMQALYNQQLEQTDDIASLSSSFMSFK